MADTTGVDDVSPKSKPGRVTDITYAHLDDAVAAAHETEWKQWYKDNFVQ